MLREFTEGLKRHAIIDYCVIKSKATDARAMCGSFAVKLCSAMNWNIICEGDSHGR